MATPEKDRRGQLVVEKKPFDRLEQPSRRRLGAWFESPPRISSSGKHGSRFYLRTGLDMASGVATPSALIRCCMVGVAEVSRCCCWTTIIGWPPGG